MPAKRELTMRQLRQMLRLHHDGVNTHEIGRSLGVARSTIRDNLGRAAKAGLVWPCPTSDLVRLWIDRDRGSLAAPPLPHHRAYGSVPRRFE